MNIFKQQINIQTTHNKGTILLNYFFGKKSAFTVELLDVIEFILGTNNFAIFYDGVPKPERMGLKGGHLSTMFLYPLQMLQIPYKGLEPTFSGVYTDFKNFLPSKHKFGMLYTLVSRCFTLCSDWTKFHSKTFQRDGYLTAFIDKCFMSVGHKLTCISKLTLAASGSN